MKRVFFFVFTTIFFAAPLAVAADPAFPELTGLTFARTFPYSMIGQLVFDSGRLGYSGSGTVIRPSSVITAGHNLYDFNHGWSTHIVFQRARYGDTFLTKKAPTRILVLAGYQSKVAYFGGDSSYAFSNDTGALRFGAPVADGGSAGWSTDTSLLTGTAYNIALGYGGEFHSGDDLLFVEPAESFTQTRNAFYENSSIYIERGMSGGPVFAEDKDGNLYVCATVVSGSDVAGGVRIFNSKVADLIRNYLR